MKRVLLTMASLMMLISMSFAQNETPMLPESHGATDNQPAWGVSQNFDLAQGWNWWSTYINATGIDQVENALGENGEQIKSSSAVAEYLNGTWTGNLAFDITKMYAIKMGTASTVSLRGTRANANDVSISLASGWNWVGYPVNFTAATNYALSTLTATQGDQIKGASSFADYDEVSGSWVGNLNELNPGKGYKIFSNNSNGVTFTYPAVPASSKGMLTSQYGNATEWQPEMASNPNNMTMIAVISMDDNELRSDNVEIGVFNGETCRGAVCPMYVDVLDQYVVFLTMYGEENEPYTFRMLDHETGAVYESNEAAIRFTTDNMIGKLRSPFELKFNSKSCTANSLQLFPNPVNRGEMVNMTLPSDGTMTVEIINMMGSTLKTMRVAGSNELSVDMASGIYTIKVTDAQGKVYVDKLVVK